VLLARRQADLGERFLDALLALGRRVAAIAQGHVDVVEKIEVRDQVEPLEDEADLFVAQFRARVVVHAAHRHAVQQVVAAGEFFQQAGDVEEGGLARARGPRHRHELAFAHVQVELAQRVRLDHVGAVDLAEFLHLEHGESLWGWISRK
jgi:hypothetical protein